MRPLFVESIPIQNLKVEREASLNLRIRLRTGRPPFMRTQSLPLATVWVRIVIALSAAAGKPRLHPPLWISPSFISEMPSGSGAAFLVCRRGSSNLALLLAGSFYASRETAVVALMFTHLDRRRGLCCGLVRWHYGTREELWRIRYLQTWPRNMLIGERYILVVL